MCFKDELIDDCLEKIDHKHFGYESLEQLDVLHVPIFVGLKVQLRSVFHKSWQEYDYQENDAHRWSRVIPLYISDRPKDVEGNYFAYTPSMDFQLETGERDNLYLQEEVATDLPIAKPRAKATNVPSPVVGASLAGATLQEEEQDKSA